MTTATRIAELESQLAAAQSQAKQNFSDLQQARTDLEAAHGQVTALTTERDEARANLATVTQERDTARAELKTEKETREQAIANGIRDGIAAAGVPAVQRDPAAKDPKSAAAAEGTSTLKGLAKVEAAIAAQLAS